MLNFWLEYVALNVFWLNVYFFTIDNKYNTFVELRLAHLVDDCIMVKSDRYWCFRTTVNDSREQTSMT